MKIWSKQKWCEIPWGMTSENRYAQRKISGKAQSENMLQKQIYIQAVFRKT